MSVYQSSLIIEEAPIPARPNSEFVAINEKQLTSTRTLQNTSREYIAELVGTLILCLSGCGTTAQVTFNSAAKGSSFLSINLGWALGLTMGVLIAGPTSGGHLNPAVTIANAFLGKFPWRKVPGYVFCQTAGGFLGAALTYFIYWPAFYDFDGGMRQVIGDKATAGIFATYPYPGTPISNAFITEVIDTAFLLLGVCAITNSKFNLPIWAVSIMAGLLLLVIGLSVGLMTGYAMNPARDFGPRLFTAIGGWGWETFTASTGYFWVPIVAPVFGALFGISLYDYFIDPEDSGF